MRLACGVSLTQQHGIRSKEDFMPEQQTLHRMLEQREQFAFAKSPKADSHADTRQSVSAS